MSRWVTFYNDVFNGVSDITIHKDKESATKFFKQNYKKYFQLALNTKVELPMSYGYPMRKFIGMSITSFNKNYGDIAEQLKENKNDSSRID